ncbi:hypothetical protein GCM10007874_31400 [Labrys miyagiensis]|uniref:Uncharacterized protein n=1 Tax=Labrys miyagiensis TaxID=346912 RepID=A0ABQ6CK79_9HYPH|nr:hypothetical protein GCM10007874_31400 [Labrys miyagiensis]
MRLVWIVASLILVAASAFAQTLQTARAPLTPEQAAKQKAALKAVDALLKALEDDYIADCIAKRNAPPLRSADLAKRFAECKRLYAAQQSKAAPKKAWGQTGAGPRGD